MSSKAYKTLKRKKRAGNTDKVEYEEVQVHVNAIAEYLALCLAPGISLLSRHIKQVQVYLNHLFETVSVPSDPRALYSEFSQRYFLPDYFRAAYGLFLILFGSHFMLTISTVQAARVGGGHQFARLATEVYQNYLQNHPDQKLEPLQQACDDKSIETFVQRRPLKLKDILEFFKYVDPDLLRELAMTLMATLMTVLASIRVNLASAITLGAGLSPLFKLYLSPILKSSLVILLPVAQHPFIPFYLDIVYGTVAAHLIWFFYSYVGIFYTSITGAHLLLVSTLALCEKTNALPKTLRGPTLKSPLGRVLLLVFSVVGVLMQGRRHLESPSFLFYIAFLPLLVLENLILTLLKHM